MSEWKLRTDLSQTIRKLRAFGLHSSDLYGKDEVFLSVSRLNGIDLRKYGVFLWWDENTSVWKLTYSGLSMVRRLNTEQWLSDRAREKPKDSEQARFQCRFVYHKWDADLHSEFISVTLIRDFFLANAYVGRCCSVECVRTVDGSMMEFGSFGSVKTLAVVSGTGKVSGRLFPVWVRFWEGLQRFICHIQQVYRHLHEKWISLGLNMLNIAVY